MSIKKILFISFLAAIFGCTQKSDSTKQAHTNDKGQAVYEDKPFVQDFSVKYYFSNEQTTNEFCSISADRDNHIFVLTDNGILVPDNGSHYR